MISESIERPAGFEDVLNPRVAQRPAGRVPVTVGSHAQCAEIADELIGVEFMSRRVFAARPGKILQVLRRAAVPADGRQGRPHDVLVVVQKPPPQFGDRQWLKGEGRRRSDGELRVDLGRHLGGRFFCVAGPAADLCRRPSR